MEIVALKVAGIIFLTVSVMHLLRVLFKVKVTAGSFVVPLWLSLLGFAITLSLSIFMFVAAR